MIKVTDGAHGDSCPSQRTGVFMISLIEYLASAYLSPSWERCQVVLPRLSAGDDLRLKVSAKKSA
jgi:hypothetical protein